MSVDICELDEEVGELCYEPTYTEPEGGWVVEETDTVLVEGNLDELVLDTAVSHSPALRDGVYMSAPTPDWVDGGVLQPATYVERQQLAYTGDLTGWLILAAVIMFVIGMVLSYAEGRVARR